LALSVPLSRFTSRVGGGSALVVRPLHTPMKLDTNRAAWWFVCLVGSLLTAGGLFGVWLQGRFYDGGFPTAATVGEVRDAFTCPTAFTTAGSLVLAAVILISPLTVSWTTTRRLVGFISFALFVIAACVACGYFAGSRVAKILN
jgi:hypothetical protein